MAILMAKRNPNFFTFLLESTWWYSLIASLASYSFLRYLLPMLIGNDSAVSNAFLGGLKQIAPYVACTLLIPAPFAFWRDWRLQAKFKDTSHRQDINTLDWKEFEWLIGEVYRRKGFTVDQNIGHGPDGGVDIELRKGGELWLVQCKHWKQRKVGVQVLRELYGVMISRQAQKMVVITSGNFTYEAVEFSYGKRFILINGDECVSMIEDIKQLPASTSTSTSTSTSKPTIYCPQCQSALVLRTAKRGPHAGKQFYGCSSFPKCRYINQTFD